MNPEPRPKAAPASEPRIDELRIYEPTLSRAIFAVFAGFVLIGLSIRAIFLIAGSWLPNLVPLLTFILPVYFVCAVLAGYVTALIGSRRPLAHALALVGVALVIGIANQTMVWALVVMVVGILTGGCLRARRKYAGT
jgi:hypothetical protein